MTTTTTTEKHIPTDTELHIQLMKTLGYTCQLRPVDCVGRGKTSYGIYAPNVTPSIENYIASGIDEENAWYWFLRHSETQKFLTDRNTLPQLWKEAEVRTANYSFVLALQDLTGEESRSLVNWWNMITCSPRLHVMAFIKVVGMWPTDWEWIAA